MDTQSTLNRAIALHQQGKLAEAESLCRQILAINRNGVAFHLLGLVCAQQGRHEEALDSIGAALQVNPRDPQALNNRGNILRALKRFDEAVASYSKALAIIPRDAVTLNNLSISLRDSGRLSEALKSCDAALTIRPNYFKALNTRGTILNTLDRTAEALASLDLALTFSPHDRDALNNRAMVLTTLRRFDEALAACDLALAGSLEDAETLNRRGCVLLAMGRALDAVEFYNRALTLNPRYSEALTNRGLAMLESGRLDDAAKSFDDATKADSSNADAFWNKGLCLLLKGDFDQGLPLYEWRKKLSRPMEARQYSQTLWTGSEDIAGKTIFLYAIEQGFGDTLQFFRFALLLAEMNTRVMLSAQDELTCLLKNAGSKVEILASNIDPAKFDYHIPLMSLPGALKTTSGNIPAGVPYLRADPERIRTWRQKIGNDGFRVGIIWQGREREIDRGRSFSLSLFEKIGALSNIRLISLQKNAGTEQLGDMPSGMRVEVLDEFDEGPDAFLDTAAVMESLDLIITSDTAAAHLAGALARPTWVGLKFLPDWRWFLNRSDSPWYPTMRLFRQTANGDWSGPFEEMQARLRAQIG